MLKLLRNRSVKRKIFIGLAIAIIPSFVLVGVMTQEDSQSMKPLGTLNGKKISVKDYLDSYRAVQHQMQFMFGERWTEMRRFINLKGEAWDRILLYEEAQQRGIKTADKEVVEWIAGQKAFQRQDKYYPELYRMAVREALRMEPRDFEEEMRKTLTVQKLSERVIAGIKIEDPALKELYQKERVLRDIEYVVLPANAADPALTADDKEIEAVYNIVKGQLTKPANDKEPERPLTLDESREEIRKQVIGQKAVEAAVKRLNELKAAPEKDLAAIAQSAGLSVQTHDAFKAEAFVPGIGQGSLIAQQVSAMKEGQTSAVLAVAGAAALVRIKKDHAPDDAAFEKDKEEFRKEITARKTQDAMKELLEKLRKKLELNTERMKEIFPDEETPGV